MALGAVTVLKKGVLAPGGLRFVILEVQPTTGANYTADGEAIPFTSANFPKFQSILFAACEPKNEASSAREFTLDITSGVAPKLVVIDAATALEVAAATDQSTFRTRIFAVGT